MAKLAGKTGWFRVGGSSYPMRNWSLRLTNQRIDTTNFTSGGFSESMSGFTSGTVRAQGFLESTLSQFLPGGDVTASLGVGGGLSTSFSGVLTEVSVSTAVDRATEVDLEMATNGVFTPSFSLVA